MAIRIDGILGNKDAVAIHRRNVSSFQAGLGWRLGMPDMSVANPFFAASGYTHACSSSPAFAPGREVHKMVTAEGSDRRATNRPPVEWPECCRSRCRPPDSRIFGQAGRAL